MNNKTYKKISEITSALFAISCGFMAAKALLMPQYGLYVAFIILVLLTIYWQLEIIKSLSTDKFVKEMAAEILAEKEILIEKLTNQLSKQLTDEFERIIKDNKVDPVKEFKKRYKEIIENFDTSDI